MAGYRHPLERCVFKLPYSDYNYSSQEKALRGAVKMAQRVGKVVAVYRICDGVAKPIARCGKKTCSWTSKATFSGVRRRSRR